METLPIPVDGDVALLAVVGSVAYGLANADSDQDLLGVYVTEGRNLLGLDVCDAVEKTVVSVDPDCAMHELGKFTRLALAANPTITELLWAQQYVTVTDDGRDLLANRDAFLSTDRVRSAWLGYARNQLGRARRRSASGHKGLDAGGQGRTAKAARHALRLVLQAEELLTTGALTLDVAGQRAEIEEAGQLAVTGLERFLANLERRIEQVERVTSVLPDTVDRHRVAATVATIRTRSLDRMGKSQ